MRVAFIVIFAIGAAYFLIKKRRFDFLTVGFFSSAVYFLPGFFGFVQFPIAYGELGRLTLIEPAYAVMIAVLSATLLGAVVYDSFPHRTNYPITLRGTESASVWAVVISVAGLLMTVATMGMALMNPEKGDVLARLNRWSIFWEVGASVAAVMAFRRRYRIVMAIAMLLILVDVFVGIRAHFAIVFIAVLTLWLEDRGRQRFIFRNRLLILSASIFIAFLFLYKFMFVPVKQGDWVTVRDLVSKESFYVDAVTMSEPFITQSILNEVLKQNFHVGVDHFGSVVYQLGLFAPSLGANVVSFNDLFQPKLFPNAIGWGMSNNIWAEMWSSGGWGLLGAFIIVHVAALAAVSRALRIEDPELRGLAALLSTYWAFYIQRNDVLTQLNLMKRAAVIGAVVIALAWLGHRALRRVPFVLGGRRPLRTREALK